MAKYAILQNDVEILQLDKNDLDSVSNALVKHFDDDYLTVYRIYPDGELSFYEYMECEFRLIELNTCKSEN